MNAYVWWTGQLLMTIWGCDMETRAEVCSCSSGRASHGRHLTCILSVNYMHVPDYDSVLNN